MTDTPARRFDPLKDRLPTDGGPIYVETDLNQDLVGTGAVVEPWNAASALLFLVIVAVWVVRLRGRYRQHPFLTCCLPLLAAGGVGGVIYHAFRSAAFFLAMDWVPITLLGMGASLYLWARLPLRMVHLFVVLMIYGAVALSARLSLPTQAAITVSYASLAMLMLVPIAMVLLRTQFLHAPWVFAAMGLFCVAVACRIGDVVRPPVLPMGTHWLWHTFGAAATVCLAEYIYRVEGMPSFKQVSSTGTASSPTAGSGTDTAGR
jgi:hypothetical protein